MTNKWVWAIAALSAVSLHAQGVWSGGSWTSGTTSSANNVALDTVPPYAKHTLAVDGNNASYGRYHYEMTPTSGEYFCTDVIGLRLCFGVMDNAWTGFQEIEAFGKNASSGMILSVR